MVAMSIFAMVIMASIARLAAADEAIWQRITPDLAGPGRFRPPRVRDFATSLPANERHVRTILKSVARRGDLYEVAPDHFFLRDTVAEIAAIIGELETPFSAATFRDRLGADANNAGRKVAIQALEFFDRHGLTVRRGDARVVDRRRLALFVPD